MIATFGRGSLAFLETRLIGGRPIVWSLWSILQTGPPRRIKTVRRQAMMKKCGENALPRNVPFLLYGQYGFHQPFISGMMRT